MNLLEILLSQENESTLENLSQQFSLSQDQTRSALTELVPALSQGLKNNTRETPGLEDLIAALETGNHSPYIDQPDILSKPATTKDGNDILGHIFGDKQVSRDVAGQAANRIGISSTILKKMLPVVASLVMGALSKKMLGGGKRRIDRSGAGGLLASLLDSDNDGSIWDDILTIGVKTLLK